MACVTKMSNWKMKGGTMVYPVANVQFSLWGEQGM